MARWRDIKKGNIPNPKNMKTSKTKKEVEKFPLNATTFTQIKSVITDLFMIIMPLMYISIYLLLGSREEFSENMLIGWGYILIPYFIITILFLKIKGQTPGLKAYEIKLVNKKDHSDATLFQIVIRQVFSLFTTISIIGLFLPFFRKDHRTIHDIIASTTIISFPNK
jgi:uncharacterized RDD family membrane protein YckC